MDAYTPQVGIIVNADDYGYFDCVSRGILKAATDGIVTATGILANSEHFDEHIAWLNDYKALDLGVHLNLTHGSPLTPGVKKRLGHFPEKHTLFKAVLSGALKPKEVKVEWRAQIERCLDKGLNLKFLNSHQHIHMLPSLFSVTLELAAEYGIQHIRISVPERLQRSASGGAVRDGIMIILGLFNHHKLKSQAPLFFGNGRERQAWLGGHDAPVSQT